MPWFQLNSLFVRLNEPIHDENMMLHPNVAAISKVKLFFFIACNFKINDVTKVTNSCKNVYITVRLFLPLVEG